MIDPVHIHLIQEDQWDTVIHLVIREFDRSVAKDYSEEGTTFFKSVVTSDFLKSLKNRNGFTLVADVGGEIVGVLSIRDCNQISLLFVDFRNQRRGIARKLLDHGIAEMDQRGYDHSVIRVHSSPFAEKVYTALGFAKEEEMKEEHGIRYIPM